MNNLSEYIIEKLQINKDASSIEGIDIEDLDNIEKVKNRNAVFTDNELSDILIYAKTELPQVPTKIKMMKTGGIKLLYRKKYVSSGMKEYWEIAIKKPETYEGSWKIEFNYDTAYHYSYPSGHSIALDKAGKPVLPDVKAAFDKINYVWKKYNFSNRIEEKDA